MRKNTRNSEQPKQGPNSYDMAVVECSHKLRQVVLAYTLNPSRKIKFFGLFWSEQETDIIIRTMWKPHYYTRVDYTTPRSCKFKQLGKSSLLILVLVNTCKLAGNKNLQHTWRVSPEGSVMQRGSLINSHPKIVGSSLYLTPVMEFFLVRIVWREEKKSD